MSKYKKDWYGNTPLYWENKKLKYFLSVKNGKEITRELPNSESSIDVYGSGGVFKWTDKVLYSGESVLFGRKGTIGKPIFVNGEFWTVDTMYYTVFGNKAYPKYFFYLMKVFPWDVITTQTALPSIVGTEVENFECSVPVYSEQAEIATYLDIKCNEIKALIMAKEKMIFLLKEQLQTIITEAVTKGLNPDVKMKDSGEECIGEIPEHWEKTRLDFIAKVKARLGWKGLKAEEYVDKGYIFLATPNLKNRFIDFEHVNYITEERYLESPEIMLQKGDVLLVKDGSTLGITNVVRELPAKATVNSSIAVIRPKEDIDSVYLYYYLSSTYIQDIINQIKDGMGVPHLFQADIKKFAIILPPLSEQKEISEYLDEKVKILDCLIDSIIKQIQKLKEYRQSLIYEVVTGKIDLRDFEVVS
ncbi:restriction endonuclease subunit S [Paenibacillus lautus]|uniref:restriction endonuclease subunit S n=1 Tax=Paenibacillus lautus TaxID=1401 RepID=UPI002FBEA8BA